MTFEDYVLDDYHRWVADEAAWDALDEHPDDLPPWHAIARLLDEAER